MCNLSVPPHEHPQRPSIEIIPPRVPAVPFIGPEKKTISTPYWRVIDPEEFGKQANIAEEAERETSPLTGAAEAILGARGFPMHPYKHQFCRHHPQRGDCLNYVGVPAVQNENTCDEWGIPYGWCDFCWYKYLLSEAQKEISTLKYERELAPLPDVLPIAEFYADNHGVYVTHVASGKRFLLFAFPPETQGNLREAADLSSARLQLEAMRARYGCTSNPCQWHPA